MEGQRACREMVEKKGKGKKDGIRRVPSSFGRGGGGGEMGKGGGEEGERGEWGKQEALVKE